MTARPPRFSRLKSKQTLEEEHDVGFSNILETNGSLSVKDFNSVFLTTKRHESELKGNTSVQTWSKYARDINCVHERMIRHEYVVRQAPH